MLALARKNHYLSIRRNVHAKATLDDAAECLTRRRVSDLTLKSRSLALELRFLRIERSQRLGLLDADCAPPDDGECNDEKNGE
jgi:hypothetical protein